MFSCLLCLLGSQDAAGGDGSGRQVNQTGQLDNLVTGGGAAGEHVGVVVVNNDVGVASVLEPGHDCSGSSSSVVGRSGVQEVGERCGAGQGHFRTQGSHYRVCSHFQTRQVDAIASRRGGRCGEV